jgi:CheY-like chemotaxis protein
LARRVRPGLLLVDLHLPDMSGLDVLAALRDELPDTRMVVVTADATASARAMAQDAGADGFVTKPIDVAQVLGLLDASA